MKKLIVIALTFVMVFALSVPAFASSSESDIFSIGDEYPYFVWDRVKYPNIIVFDKGNYHKILFVKSYEKREPTNASSYSYEFVGTLYRTLIDGGTAWELENTVDSDYVLYANDFTYSTITFPNYEVPQPTITPVVYEFTTYNGVSLPVFPSGVTVESGNMLISRISGLSFGDEFANSSYYILDVSTSEATVTYDGSYVVFNYADNTTLHRYIYTADLGLAEKLWAQGNKASTFAWGDVNLAYVDTSSSYGVDEVVWSNYDVKREDGTTFFPPPLSLAQTVRGVQLTEVMTGVVMMIPLCLAFLVGYVGLRKALALLQKTLSQA